MVGASGLLGHPCPRPAGRGGKAPPRSDSLPANQPNQWLSSTRAQKITNQCLNLILFIFYEKF